jgi:hypothetical protein
MTRRELAAGIVSRVIREHEQAEEKAIRKALRGAYPWGPRENYPYEVWSEEVRLGLALWRRRRGIAPPEVPAPVVPDPRQIKLF